MIAIQVAVQIISLVVFCICAYKIIKVAWGYTFKQQSKPLAPVSVTKNEYLKLLLTVFCLYLITFAVALACSAREHGGMYVTPLSIYGALRDVFTKGDALHYMHIAKYGYVTEGLARNWIAFYPMFPMIVRLVREVVRSYYLSSIIVNFTCTYISAIFLYKLILGETGNKKYAFRAVLLMVTVPQSLFYVAPYGEAMFFAFTLICVYNIRKGKFFTAAVFGFLSAITRNVGIVIAAVFVVEYLNQNLSTIKKEGSWIPHISKSVAMCLLILLGQVAYLALNYVVTGSPSTYSIYQKEYWGQGVGNFVSTIGYLISYIPNPHEMEWILNLPSIATFAFYLFVMYKKGDKIRPSYGLYALCYFFIIFAPTRLLSGMRYSMVAFPLYFMLCDLEDKWFYIVLTVFINWWIYFMVAFGRGFYVF